MNTALIETKKTNMNTVTLYFTKEFTRGILKGLVINESLPFVSVERSQVWLKGVIAKEKKLGYKIIDRSYQNYAR